MRCKYNPAICNQYAWYYTVNIPKRQQIGLVFAFRPLGITFFFSSNGLRKWICKLQPNRKNNCTPEAVDHSEFTPESHDGWKMIEFRSLGSWPIFGGELINFQGLLGGSSQDLQMIKNHWLVSPLSTATFPFQMAFLWLINGSY